MGLGVSPVWKCAIQAFLKIMFDLQTLLSIYYLRSSLGLTSMKFAY